MNAGEVIEEARDHHPTFDVQTHPNKILLRYLGTWQKHALGQGIIRYPDLFDDGPTTIAIADFDFEAGYPLNQPFNILDAEAIGVNDQKYPFILIDPSARHDPRPMFCGWIRSGTLYLDGRAQDWTGITDIVLRWASTPVDLGALDDELVLPDSARYAAVTALAAFMAGRDLSRGDLPAPSKREMREQAAEALNGWLESLWLQRSATDSTIREVW